MAQQERAIATREKLVSSAAKVFARMHFETARVADILDESEITQGAFYHHFPNGKHQIAEELINRQTDQFERIRDEIAGSDLDGISSVLALSDLLGRTLSTDHTAQAGIRLVTQASSVFPDIAELPDPAWLNAVSAFLHRADGEGHLRKDVVVPDAARSIIYLFTGAQVSSFVNDNWSQISDSLRGIESFVLRSIAVDGFELRHYR